MSAERPDPNLQKVGIFAACSDSQLNRLGHIVRPVDFADVEFICHEGEVADAFQVVLEGQAVLTARGMTVQTCGPGEFIGEVAMLARKPRLASVQAVGTSVVGVVHAQDFDELLIDIPVLARLLLRGMAERIWEGFNSGNLEVTGYG
jgi:CRP-like cAMP-binding protein